MTIAPLSYVINQLSLDDFLGLIPASVHQTYPLHLIGHLQISGGTGVPGQGRQKLFHAADSSVLDLQAVVKEPFSEHQLVVIDWVVLLEERLPQMPWRQLMSGMR